MPHFVTPIVKGCLEMGTPCSKMPHSGLTHGCLGIVRYASVGHVSLKDALIGDALLGNAEAESIPWFAWSR